ncbi:MADS-box domain-containing protein [Aphelenchoides fujianensis]|nr:MADS-box domain-containing protein [Aphelenchoides fujianensis]
MSSTTPARYNLNFSNPGGGTASSAFQSLLLSPTHQTCSSPSDEMAAGDSEGSGKSTPQVSAGDDSQAARLLPNGKKTKGRVKIKMEYIGNKLRRYTTFSKRKTGIMKKAHELSTLTGTQVMLLVASETGHCYAFSTHKLKPLITTEPGKTLIQSCLNAPDDPVNDSTAIKTEFTFESSNPAANAPTRKRKYGGQEVAPTLSLPTMVPVSSTSPVDRFDGSDGDSDCEGEEDESGTPLAEGGRLDPAHLQRTLQEAFRLTNMQRAQASAARRPKEVVQKPSGRPSRPADAQNLDWILPLLLQGLSDGDTSASHSNTPFTRSSPPPSSSSVLSRTGTSAAKQKKRPAVSRSRVVESPPQREAVEPTVLFQLPQGTVYAADESLESPPPLSAASPLDSSALFSASGMASGSPASSASPSAAQSNDDAALQQLLGGFPVGNGGITLQQLLALSQLNNDAAGGKG